MNNILLAPQLESPELALPALLQRVAESAREIVAAGHCSLSVFGPDGEVSEVFTAGSTPGEQRLQATIRIRGEEFGTLTLTDPIAGGFAVEDQRVLDSVAASAAIVIDNARLFEMARQRQDWLQACAEITSQLLSLDGEPPLTLIARRLSVLADADLVTVDLPSADGRRLLVEVAIGSWAEQVRARSLPVQGSLAGVALRSGVVTVLEDFRHIADGLPDDLTGMRSMGPAMAIPLSNAVGVRGVICAFRRRDRPTFDAADVAMATMFGGHAAVALELIDARIDQQRLQLLEDRQRTAQQMHDNVIQRLFASGMSLQSVVSGMGKSRSSVTLLRAANEIDDAVREIRQSGLQPSGPLSVSSVSVCNRLADVVAAYRELLGFTPELQFIGPVDALVSPALCDDVVTLLREALLNVAQHAEATQVEVTVQASPQALTVRVDDNGRGLAEAPHRRGLSRLETMAEQRAGRLDIRDDEGAHLTWTIPLNQPTY